MVADADVVHAADHIIESTVEATLGRRRQQIGDIVDLDVELALLHHVPRGAGIPIDRTRHVVVVDGRIVDRLEGRLHRAASRVALHVVVAEHTGVEPALYQREAAPAVGIVLGVYNLPGRNRAALSIISGAGAVVAVRAGLTDTHRTHRTRAQNPLVRLRAQGAKCKVAWYAPVLQLELVGSLKIHASGDDAGDVRQLQVIGSRNAA